MTPSERPLDIAPVRVRHWIYSGRTVEITHTRDLTAADAALLQSAVRAYLEVLASPHPIEGQEG